ncbi:hypothetical protein H4Q26_016358 [Puccinia striiformis f. sp. tritici PST-130]|nr:hypothetical protein H4Q26_016358 [Puccinia striiformis f. sp. tritici PST-130]
MIGVNQTSLIKPCEPDEEGECAVVPVLLSTMDGISKIRIFLAQDLKPLDARKTAMDAIGKSSEDHKVISLADFKDQYKLYEEKQQVNKLIQQIQLKISNAENVIYIEDLKKRKTVLRSLGFCNSDDIVQVKGRVACEISSGDELLLTELIFNGAFNDLSPDMTDIFEGSLIRCFRRLQELIRQMSCAAKSIGNEELETKFTQSLDCLERPSSVVYNIGESGEDSGRGRASSRDTAVPPQASTTICLRLLLESKKGVGSTRTTLKEKGPAKR